MAAETTLSFADDGTACIVTTDPHVLAQLHELPEAEAVEESAGTTTFHLPRRVATIHFPHLAGEAR